jgi:hypothetical protein
MSPALIHFLDSRLLRLPDQHLELVCLAIVNRLAGRIQLCSLHHKQHVWCASREQAPLRHGERRSGESRTPEGWFCERRGHLNSQRGYIHCSGWVASRSNSLSSGLLMSPLFIVTILAVQRCFLE